MNISIDHLNKGSLNRLCQERRTAFISANLELFFIVRQNKLEIKQKLIDLSRVDELFEDTHNVKQTSLLSKASKPSNRKVCVIHIVYQLKRFKLKQALLIERFCRSLEPKIAYDNEAQLNQFDVRFSAQRISQTQTPLLNAMPLRCDCFENSTVQVCNSNFEC